jgi:hypothetical protein
LKSINNNYRNPFGITEGWDIWDTQIKKLKEKNDLLADAGEMPETGNRSGGKMFSSDNQSMEVS